MTALQLYNTLTNQKEIFTPINPGKVAMYTCGPTVYDYLTIGNIRSYMSADTLHRYLLYSGYEVKLIKNITDVGHLTDDDVAQGDSGEDKMLKKARLEKKDPFEIARFYENAALEDEKELSILPATYHPRATEHIPQMLQMIEALIRSDHAYESDGNVFFDVSSFDKYGQLSGNTLENLHVGARLEDPHTSKRNQWDFALWLKAPKDHLMQWDSPWSRGYPGWHIECSAMSNEYLGDTFDIHTGGEDNIFPHQEAEIAQTECFTGKTFVHYWFHTRHLLIEGERMGKSKGNAYILSHIKEKGFEPLDLRMIYLLSHYRSQMNFTWESLEQAKSNRKTLERFFSRLKNYVPHSKEVAQINVPAVKERFENAMNDDLNTPQALSEIFALITEGNQKMDTGYMINKDEICSFFYKIATDVLGFTFTSDLEHIPAEITTLTKAREEARKAKDYAESDRLRDEIVAAGYAIEDTPDGYTLNKI